LTLARNVIVQHDPKRYDRRVSTPESGWPLRRIVLLPLVLFVVVSGTVFTLANLHPAKPEATTGAVTLGDVQRGQIVYKKTCASCHGGNAQGGVGPRLAGTHLTSAQVKAQIDNGGGIMPAHLVTGAHEADVIAYVDSIATG
jgi:mono/diheme cytochrome c family protein